MVADLGGGRAAAGEQRLVLVELVFNEVEQSGSFFRDERSILGADADVVDEDGTADVQEPQGSRRLLSKCELPP